MTTFEVPAHVGTGVYRTLDFGKHAIASFCDLTPTREMVVDERSVHAGLVFAFNLSGQQQWRNHTTGREHVLHENHFGIFGGGSFATTNVIEEGQHTIQMGLKIGPGRYTEMLRQACPDQTICDFDQLPRNAGLELPPAARNVIHDMLACNYTPDIRSMYLEAKLMELVAVLAGELTTVRKSGREGIRLSGADYDGLAAVKTILDKDYADSPTIQQLVRPAMMNEHKLKRAFKQQYGTTIHRYIIRKRMEQARELLESGNVSVMEAAHQVGYVNSSHFISQFRQTYGYNPSVLKC